MKPEKISINDTLVKTSRLKEDLLKMKEARKSEREKRKKIEKRLKERERDVLELQEKLLGYENGTDETAPMDHPKIFQVLMDSQMLCVRSRGSKCKRQ
jgi:hypothetical protein